MKLLRIQEVIRVTGLSRMTIYRYEKSGEFPKRRRIGKNSVRWLDQDIETWMTSRPVATTETRNATQPRDLRRH
jgi:prophage regulatory protein